MTTDIITRALAFVSAAFLSAGHKRVPPGEDLIVHPRTVAQLVVGTGARPSVVAAALLHDVIDETSTTLVDIWSAFGADVASLVSQLDVYRPLPETTLEYQTELSRRLSAKASYNVRTIMLADFIDHARMVSPNDPAFQIALMRERKDFLQVADTGDIGLHKLAESIWKAWNL